MQMVSDPPMQIKVDVDTNKTGKTVCVAQVVLEMLITQGNFKRKGSDNKSKTNLSKLCSLNKKVKKVCRSNKVNWSSTNLCFKFVKKEVK